jgi:hypothetical protein
MLFIFQYLLFSRAAPRLRRYPDETAIVIKIVVATQAVRIIIKEEEHTALRS